MFDPKRSKVLFSCLFAYSGGQPVTVFNVEQNDMQYDEACTASASPEAAVKMAVARGLAGQDSDMTKRPELLAAAYEMFITDRERFKRQIEWLELKLP